MNNFTISKSKKYLDRFNIIDKGEKYLIGWVEKKTARCWEAFDDKGFLLGSTPSRQLAGELVESTTLNVGCQFNNNTKKDPIGVWRLNDVGYEIENQWRHNKNNSDYTAGGAIKGHYFITTSLYFDTGRNLTMMLYKMMYKALKTKNAMTAFDIKVYYVPSIRKPNYEIEDYKPVGVDAVRIGTVLVDSAKF